MEMREPTRTARLALAGLDLFGDHARFREQGKLAAYSAFWQRELLDRDRRQALCSSDLLLFQQIYQLVGHPSMTNTARSQLCHNSDSLVTTVSSSDKELFERHLERKLGHAVADK